MSKLIKIDNDYAGWIKDLSLRFRQSQIKAAVKVNSEMLKFYFSLGADIVTKQAESKWGDGFFRNLSMDLHDALPGIKSFSETNLKYAKYFYQLYEPLFRQQVVDKIEGPDENKGNKDGFSLHVPDYEKIVIRQQIVDELPVSKIFCIPWGHHVQIINKCNGDTKRAFFYVNKVYDNNWSRSVLLNFLDTNLYERQGKAVTNFKTTLPAVDSDLAQQLTKDPYCFDFVGLTEPYREKELKEALLHNITKFLLELGNGFAYMGKEYRLQVGDTEQSLDLLFYNVELRAYVVVEVKVTSFEPGHLGQLSAYVSCVNHLLKKPADNATIGLLVCKDKDNVFAQYSLEGYNQPLGISGFEMSKVMPSDFKSTLPSIEDIERELR